MGHAFERFKGSRVWSSDRPRDSACAAVDLISVVVAHRNGSVSYQLNDLRQAGAQSQLALLEPLDGVFSVASGEPAILINTSEAQFALTPKEANRFASLALYPTEFFAICDAVGCVWLTSAEFYEPETGLALQPMEPQ